MESNTTPKVCLTIEGIEDLHYSRQYRKQQNDPTYCHTYSNVYVSPYIIYHDGYPCYLYDTRIGRRTMTDITWICQSVDDDSLVFYHSFHSIKITFGENLVSISNYLLNLQSLNQSKIVIKNTLK